MAIYNIPTALAKPLRRRLDLRADSLNMDSATSKAQRSNGFIANSRESRRGLTPRHSSKRRSLILLLGVLLFQTAVVVTAYLNGANRNSELPTRTATKSAFGERYAFLKKPRDRYFTSKGILPPLDPALDQKACDEEEEEADIWVTYTNDPNTVDEWLCRNVPYDGCFLGFDIERLPECRSKTCHPSDRYAFAHAAVVQLATPTACLVVHLVDIAHKDNKNHPRHSNACSRILKSVLEDSSIIKAGCSIDEDLVLLHELWDKQHNHGFQQNGKKKAPKKKRNSRTNSKKTVYKNIRHHQPVPSLQARSRFDLGCVVLPKNHSMANESTTSTATNYKFVAKKITTIANKSGLRGLCEFVLGVDLPKEKDTCASDWTRFPLSDDQITYAARDAWAGATIATKLATMESKLNSQGQSSVFSRPNLIQVLRKTETPLSQLAHRHRQRKEAKSELHTLLHPYARNLVLNQQNLRRQQELSQKQQNNTHIALNSTVVGNHKFNRYRHNNTIIDVSALFADYPLSARRTLANYAQKQQQLMEKSLPKQIRQRSIVLRQTVNAKVIDHKVLFEVDLVGKKQHKDNKNMDNPKNNYRKRRNYEKRVRDSNSSKNRRQN